MEAQAYGGFLLGVLLAMLGIYLLFKRVRGHKTEINVAGFGTIKTTHHGMTLTFLGVALVVQAQTVLIQQNELNRSYEQLKNSQAFIVSFLTPSLLADTAFQNYFKVAPSSQQEAILRRANGMLRPEFRRVTDMKQSNFGEQDFAALASVYNFLFALDPNDGSALYYKGEVARLLRRRHLMRENFNLYLSHAPAPHSPMPPLIALGYFDERTGWIHHLLANDFLCETISAAPTSRHDLRERVRDHVKGERAYWVKGFSPGETTISTDALERTIEEGFNNKSMLKCPDM